MQKKHEWKTWHKVAIGVLILIIIGVTMVPDETESVKNSTTLTPAQKDSLLLAKRIEEGRTMAIVNLRVYVTERLNDPKSFDVIDQKTFLVGDSSIVAILDYTAKNMFGGVVRQTIKAETDADGNIVRVVE